MPFIIPNPWHIGSARLLACLGFSALATTSSGHAASPGRPDAAQSDATRRSCKRKLSQERRHCPSLRISRAALATTPRTWRSRSNRQTPAASSVVRSTAP
ncbi:MAG: isocitrate lyase/phosphoenolpyruvate mutase family protein [Myxococcota bacterium]